MLSEFARTLLADFPIKGILDHLVLRIVDIMPIDAAGVTLISADAKPEMFAGSDESATRYEQLQTTLGEGPCLAAYETETPISVRDLSDDDRFPTFAERAIAEGLTAVFAFPLRNAGRCLGALDLYRSTSGPLDDAEMAAAQTLADVTTAYLLNAEDRLTKTDLVANVSHELRTPLTSIYGFVELLREGAVGDLNPKQTSFIEAIGRNSERLLKLANDLLVLSHQPSSLARQGDDVDLGNVARAVQSALTPAMAASGRSVTFDLPTRPVLVRGDARNLESVVSNLVGNAMKFTDEDGWVRCTLRRTLTHASLAVSDNGIGVPLDEQEELFTRFFRSSNAAEREVHGSGLGLTIADSIVRSHGGNISVISREMDGSTFTVILPLAHHGRGPRGGTPSGPND